MDSLFVLILWIYLPWVVVLDQVDLGLHGLELVVELVGAQLLGDILVHELLDGHWLH